MTYPLEDEIAAPEKAGLAMTDKVIVERFPSVSGVEILAMTVKTPFVIASGARQSRFFGLLQEAQVKGNR
jgi:hypothetical protein